MFHKIQPPIWVKCCHLTLSRLLLHLIFLFSFLLWRLSSQFSLLKGLSVCKLLSRRRFLRHLQFNMWAVVMSMNPDCGCCGMSTALSPRAKKPLDPPAHHWARLPSLWISLFSSDLETCSDKSNGNLTFALKVGKNGDCNTCTVEKGKKAGNGYLSSFKWTIHLYSEIGEILSTNRLNSEKGDDFISSWNLRRINSGLSCLYLFAPSD